jgi:hypothetical protein
MKLARLWVEASIDEELLMVHPAIAMIGARLRVLFTDVMFFCACPALQ